MSKPMLFKYGQTEQFRTIAKKIQLDSVDSSIEFERTVKIHGANCSIVYNFLEKNKEDKLYAQSRNRLITVENDFMGFAKYVQDNYDALLEQISCFCSEHALATAWDDETHLVVYGEWCGQGIQSGTAVNNLPNKIYVPFGARLIYDNDIEHWKSRKVAIDKWDDIDDAEPMPLSNHDINLYNVREFGVDKLTIDFSNPSLALESLVEACNKVEVQCPVGTFFGCQGIGEGHVYVSENGRYTFKIKGEKHKVSKTAKILTPEEEEQIYDAKNFVAQVLSRNRLKQGIDYMEEMNIPIIDMTTFSQFAKWIYQDVIKEEGDLIESIGLDPKRVSKEISTVCRKFYQELLEFPPVRKTKSIGIPTEK